jgi:hypothetical protein
LTTLLKVDTINKIELILDIPSVVIATPKSTVLLSSLAERVATENDKVKTWLDNNYDSESEDGIVLLQDGEHVSGSVKTGDVISKAHGKTSV